MVDIREYDLQELVGDDGASIGKTKQGVISEHRLDSHGSSVENTFMAQCTEGLQIKENTLVLWSTEAQKTSRIP